MSRLKIKIVEGDCLDVMRTLPERSIDLVLCDPPYGVTNCGWDKVLPLEPMWAEYRRLLKPFVAVVLTACQPFTSRLVLSNLKWFRHELVWDKVKVTGFLSARRYPMRRHENILVFGPHLPHYDPQYTQGKPYTSTRRPRAIESLGEKKALTVETTTVCDGRRFPTSIVTISNRHVKGEKRHPTQKPVELFEWLIRTYSKRGDMVLDNCLGSGTTALAAHRTGRACVGIERDPRFIAIARERLRLLAEQTGDAPGTPGARKFVEK